MGPGPEVFPGRLLVSNRSYFSVWRVSSFSQTCPFVQDIHIPNCVFVQ